ncbi:MAG: response regulator transcription factor [Rhodoferax sp.]|nr:response regulator transcription factor [Rhodoferax sp.]
MKILVVDDHALVREGLSQVLQGLDAQHHTEVLQAADCTQAFELAQTHPDLDLVLLDYHLPDMDGLTALGVLGQRHPELPVVILSGSANPSIMQRLMEQGAAGFITKSGLSSDLLDSLRRVLKGEVVVPKEFAPRPAGAGLTCAAPVFTQRQQEVLKLIQRGYSNREIGDKLNLAEETIKSHVTLILRILGVSSRLQAAMEGRRWGYGMNSTPAP